MIKDGMVVQLAYTLKSKAGDVLDQADAKSPFVYLHGAGQIVPGLEKALSGLKSGDKKNVEVSAAEGYGEIQPELKMKLKRTQFPEKAELKPGVQFEASTPDGEDVIFTIEAINGDEVHIDGNHPLAGQSLHFAVEVLSAREATSEEMAHGHAHGPDGHHHH